MEDIREKMKSEFMFDNVYTEEYTNDEQFSRDVQRARRTQTRMQDYSQTVDDIESERSDYEEMEIDPNFAPSLFTDVLENIEEHDDEDALARRNKRNRYKVGAKRKKKVPKFDIDDILGKFDVDRNGDYMIIREKDGKLYDKMGRQVNKRGYLIDKLGNIINKHGKIIMVGGKGAIDNNFGYEEMNSDDDLPPPYAFQKRKKRLLNQDYKAKPKKSERVADIEDLDDEDQVEAKLNEAKQASKRHLSDFTDSLLPSKRRNKLKDSDVDTSFESLMAVNPNTYQHRRKKTKRTSRRTVSKNSSSKMSERIINIATKHQNPPKNYQKQISKIIEKKRSKNK